MIASEHLLERSQSLGARAREIRDMLEHVGGEDHVGRAVADRQPVAVRDYPADGIHLQPHNLPRRRRANL